VASFFSPPPSKNKELTSVLRKLYSGNLMKNSYNVPRVIPTQKFLRKSIPLNN
jgi:hypothetical protein